MLARLLNLGGKADAKSTALAAFLLESALNRRALFGLLADAVEGGDVAREILKLGRDLWPDLLHR